MLGARKDILLMQGGVVRGSMINKFRPPDVELGKKDDDHKFKPARRSGFTLRWRRKRILVVVLGLIAFSVFMHYTGSSSGERQSVRANPFAYTPPSRDPAHDSDSEPRWNEIQEPTGAPPGMRSPGKGEATPHTFSGAFKFYRLARSLHGASHTDGYHKTNRNILFAASSLTSASTLIPLACEMARWNRNWVHVAFLGRVDIPLDDILVVNGVDREKCKVLWHDARPDYSEWSTEERAQRAVQSALTHIQSFLHPQVAIVDDEGSEDAFFNAGVRNRTDALGMPRIEVPAGKSEEYTWMTRLDAGSLSAWHTPTVDILVQVPADTSSVLHLLKSLKEADYAGLGYPRIMLDLPPALDPTVQRVLESFVWPHTRHANSANQLVLRRRIAHRATQESAAIAFAESFYPGNTDAHVLVLDPAAQLAPSYFHYVKYVLLEYRYASSGDDSSSVMGVSLELPSMLVDGKTALTPPGRRDMHAAQYTALADPSDETANGEGVPFAMQAPASHATLFFEDAWTEWHSFLSERVSMHQQRKSKGKGASRVKQVSESLPSWAEYMLEFMRARGYFLLYPATTGAEAIVRVHGEMVRAPEEFTPPPFSSSDEEDAEPKLRDLHAPFLRAASPPPSPKTHEPPLLSHSQPLHRILPFDADLPEVEHLPKLLYNGHKMDPSSIAVVAAKYRRQFMEEVGGCTVPKGKRRRVVEGSAGDLFCFGDEGEEVWVDDWVLAGEGAKGTPVAAKADAVQGVGKAAAATSFEDVVAATPSLVSSSTPIPTLAKKLAGGVHDI